VQIVQKGYEHAKQVIRQWRASQEQIKSAVAHDSAASPSATSPATSPVAGPIIPGSGSMNRNVSMRMVRRASEVRLAAIDDRSVHRLFLDLSLLFPSSCCHMYTCNCRSTGRGLVTAASLSNLLKARDS
jgi:hypothetical protein